MLSDGELAADVVAFAVGGSGDVEACRQMSHGELSAHAVEVHDIGLNELSARGEDLDAGVVGLFALDEQRRVDVAQAHAIGTADGGLLDAECRLVGKFVVAAQMIGFLDSGNRHGVDVAATIRIAAIGMVAVVGSIAKRVGPAHVGS